MRRILWRVIAAPSFAAFSASATMPVQPGGPLRLQPGQPDMLQRSSPETTPQSMPQSAPRPGARRGSMLDISV
jgi:hypothetical protein